MSAMADKTQGAVMADFVFGGIESDEGRLLESERKRWSGLRHAHALDPLDPAPGQAVRITVTVGPDVNVDRVAAYYTADGSEPAGSRGRAVSGEVALLERVDIRWEALIWDYVEVWQGELPGQPEGAMVRYRIEGWLSSGEGESAWSREQNMDRSVERPSVYGYAVDRFAPPAWAHDAVIYQVFVDRFSGVENRWLEPDEMERFTGGMLAGVTAKLDYIAGLGVNAVWLTPIFRTTHYHGYDTSDYYAIDPRFGTEDDLRALVAGAHERGLRVILDFVANHTAQDFAPFAEAVRMPDSQYRSWYTFDPVYKHGYRSFFDVATMPQFDTDFPAVRRYLCEAAAHWLREFDVDGFRLDYAAGPSHSFWSEFRAACRAVKADCWLFGEVTRTGDLLRTYMGRLDGCLDFAFARSVRLLTAYAQPVISVGRFAAGMERSREFFGGGESFLLPSFIDNHDMNRYLWVASNDQQRLRLAAGLMFAFGGPPVIYYGTEVGLSQPRAKGPYREESRHPMLWGEAQDAELLAWFQAWIGARRRHPALARGAIRTLHVDDEQGVWLAEREHEGDRVLAAVNVSGETRPLPLEGGAWRDLVTGEAVKAPLLEPLSVQLLGAV